MKSMRGIDFVSLGIGLAILFIIKIKMSKLRTRLDGRGENISRSRVRQLLERSVKHNHKSTMHESKIFEQTRCHTIESDQTQIDKDRLYNKNITKFRESFRPNNSHILPFLASLRAMKDYRHAQTAKGVTLSPFEADRPTANQKVKKSINDIKANPFRLSKAYYRWQNHSGQGNKNSCEFECSLRLDQSLSNSNNPQSSSFNNTLAPIRLRTLQAPRYKGSDLICDRQRRLFTLEPE